MNIATFLRTPGNGCFEFNVKAEETEVISRLLITFVTYKFQKHLVKIFCLYPCNLFMKDFCVLYPKIFTSNIFIKPKLPGIQDKHSISRSK